MINALIAGIIAYLLGSVTFGMIVPKFMGTSADVRNEGSGNVGATNVLRTRGKLQGALVLVGDLLKGALAAWIGLSLAGPVGGGVAGLCAMAGHCFPLYYGFKGGKGVATGAGIVCVILPEAMLFLVPLFLVAVGLSRMVSLGSVAAALALILCLPVCRPPAPVVVFCAVAAALVIWKHRANIKRILAGTENKLW